MNIKAILWTQPRDVLLYSCEAYRTWMIESKRSSLAETYAEFPLATYVGFILFALITTVYPNAGHLGRLNLAFVFLLALCVTHAYLKRNWGLAATVFARYRPIPYVRDVIVNSFMVMLFVVMFVLTRDSPVLIVCAVLAHWITVGTVFYALMERRRLPDQPGEPSPL
jgi:hypothetical protein